MAEGEVMATDSSEASSRDVEGAGGLADVTPPGIVLSHTRAARRRSLDFARADASVAPTTPAAPLDESESDETDEEDTPPITPTLSTIVADVRSAGPGRPCCVDEARSSDHTRSVAEASDDEELRVIDLDSGARLSVSDVERIYEARDLDTGVVHSLIALSAREGIVDMDGDGDGRGGPYGRRAGSRASALSRSVSMLSDEEGAGGGGARPASRREADAAMVLSASGLHSGLLLKRGRRMNAWKQRWCRVTRDGRLEAYAHGPDARGRLGRSKLDINLAGTVLRLALPDDELNAEWAFLAKAVARATAGHPTAFDRARASGSAARRLSKVVIDVSAGHMGVRDNAAAGAPAGANGSARGMEQQVTRRMSRGTAMGLALRFGGRRESAGEHHAGATTPSNRGGHSRRGSDLGTGQLFGFVISWGDERARAKAERARAHEEGNGGANGGVGGSGGGGAGGGSMPLYEERSFYCTSAAELEHWLRTISHFAACQMSLRLDAAHGGAESDQELPDPAAVSGTEIVVTDQHGFLLAKQDAASYAKWMRSRSGPGGGAQPGGTATANGGPHASPGAPRSLLSSLGVTDVDVQWRRWLQQVDSVATRGQPPPPIPDGLIWGGVPSFLRARVWLRCSGALRYAQLLPGYYDVTVTKAKFSVSAQIASEIERDLHRTFPNHPHFSGQMSLGVRALRRVLLAFAQHNPGVGYCQALNYVCGLLLIANSFEEEPTFWLLACIVEQLTPDFYSKEMSGITAQQESFNSFVVAILPQLAAHIERVGMPLSFVTTNWFMTLFANCLPSETVMRIWDVLFFDGPLVLSLVGAALMKFGAKSLMTTSSLTEVAEQLTALGRHEWDADALLAAACFRGMDKQQRAVLAGMRRLNAETMGAARKSHSDAVNRLI